MRMATLEIVQTTFSQAIKWIFKVHGKIPQYNLIFRLNHETDLSKKKFLWDLQSNRYSGHPSVCVCPHLHSECSTSEFVDIRASEWD